MSAKMVNNIQFRNLWLIATAISAYKSKLNRVLHKFTKVCAILDDICMKMKYLNFKKIPQSINKHTGCGIIINQIMEDS